MTTRPATAVLRRVLAAPPPQQRAPACEMCGVAYGDRHSHVVGLDTRALMCTCRPCALLFSSPAAGGGRYRAVPERYLSFPDGTLNRAHWDALDIPVGVAFVFRNSALGRLVACYPSPAGATESELSPDAWSELLEADPTMGTVADDVEGVLMRITGQDVSCHVVPIDRCYELVGHLRQNWRGFDGGREAHDVIEAFFAEIQSRSRPAP